MKFVIEGVYYVLNMFDAFFLISFGFVAAMRAAVDHPGMASLISFNQNQVLTVLVVGWVLVVAARYGWGHVEEKINPAQAEQ